MDSKLKIQELAYRFPYHYIPSLNLPDRASTFKRWTWSLSYLIGLRFVTEWITKHQQAGHRHLDVGCGDGALIHFLQPLHKDVTLVGTDYDHKALEWARLFNQGIEFVQSDLVANHEVLTKEVEAFDTISLVEVAEHIDPKILPAFMANVASLLKPSGRLLLTVPHANVRVSKKHFQHFTFQSIQQVLPKSLQVEEIGSFDYLPTYLKLLVRLMKNSHVFCEMPALERILFRKMWRTYSGTENSYCGRILLTAKRI